MGSFPETVASPQSRSETTKEEHMAEYEVAYFDEKGDSWAVLNKDGSPVEFTEKHEAIKAAKAEAAKWPGREYFVACYAEIVYTTRGR